MSRNQSEPFEYDVAISFAREDQEIAQEIARLLRAKDILALEDEAQAARLGGSDFVTHIAELYRTKAYYCILLISRHYPLQTWTEAERTAAQEHALRDADKYILPFLLDDSEVPGIREASGFRDVRQGSLASLMDGIGQELAQTKAQSSPPSPSHDLRSGNVPPAHASDQE